MKYIYLLTIVALTSLSSIGQVRFGVKGGLNIANQSVKVNVGGFSASQSGGSIPSFHLGAFADIPLSAECSFVPELLFTGKGSDFNGEDDNGDPAVVKLRPYYLELPLDIEYQKTLRSGVKFLLGAGPSLGYGLFGNAKSGDSTAAVFQSGGFKRFDFGLNYIVGVELKSGIIISTNFSMGLISVADTQESQGSGIDDLKWRNRTFSFSIGYILNKKK